jgi:hypothetical protein
MVLPSAIMMVSLGYSFTLKLGEMVEIIFDLLFLRSYLEKPPVIRAPASKLAALLWLPSGLIVIEVEFRVCNCLSGLLRP